MLREFADCCEVYLITGYTDMRKGIDGLAAMIQGQLILNPFDKSLYLFCGRNRSKMKGLLWEGDGFYVWLSTLDPSKGSGLASAVQYALNEKQYLYAFLEDPDIPVDNNMAERAVKPFVIGRKNWLFSTSPKGAQASAMAYSVITTAQENGVDVREYLARLFGTGELALPLKNE